MSNIFTNWLRNRKFSAALDQGNIQLAQELLEKKQAMGVKLSLLEKVFKEKTSFEQSSSNYEREVIFLRTQISQVAEQLANAYSEFGQSRESAQNQVARKEQEVILIQQRLEARNQETQNLQNQLKYTEQKFDSIQQQLETRNQETNSIKKHLAISIEEIEALWSRLKHKEQELNSVQQQIEARNQETDSIQTTLEKFKQQIEVLHDELKLKNELVASVQKQIKNYEQHNQNLLNQIAQPLLDNLLIAQNEHFNESVKTKFKFNEINDNLLQCTGIDKEIFYDLEENIVNYLKVEFERYTPHEQLNQHLIDSNKDIASLQNGRDPEYNSYLTPHIYFMRYFLEGVYSAYLAWFLVYKSKLLQTKVSILDIGAGSGAMIYGLFSLFKSIDNYNKLSEIHVSYCSLEQQNLLQHHGLEFWKQYIERQKISAVNTYYRFKTIDLFAYGNNGNEDRELPNKFFDFVVISHCIFSNTEQRVKSHQVYKKIFIESLKDNGYVLIIVQGRRLFQSYNRPQTEDRTQEEKLIKDFINELGLKLEWYKYIASTGEKIPLDKAKFGNFAKKNLPAQPYMSLLLRQYLDQRYDSNYVLDDYAILAKKS